MKTETPATPHPRACCLTNPRACCIPRARRLVLPALAVVYAGLLTFPGGLFAHHAMLGPFHVASDAPIDPARRAFDLLQVFAGNGVASGKPRT